MLRFQFTRVSSNSKTGPIPTVIVSRDTCPPSCPLYNGGCYALGGNVRIHWDRATRQGGTFKSLLENVAKLPVNQVWRYGVAGDLPGNAEAISPTMMRQLIAANRGRQGFAYTHKNPNDKKNAKLIKAANAGGLTINLSANNLAQADEYLALGIAPVVTIVPHDLGAETVTVAKPVAAGTVSKTVTVWKHTLTPGGNRVIQCPAEYNDNVQCANCGGAAGPLCQRADRKFVVGFTTHGASKRKASAIARGLPVLQ